VRIATFLLFGLAATAVLAGCGSSRLSHGAYVKRANAICKQYNTGVKSLTRPTSVTEIETYARRVLIRYRRALAQLEALDPPKDDAVTVNQWLTADRLIAKDVEAIAAAAHARRIPAVQSATEQAAVHNAASDRLARELGLTACVAS
jgi:hypothetical protein